MKFDSIITKISFIKKLPNGKYKVLSRKGKNMGIFDSKSDAERRLQQIEFFKRQASINIDDADEFTYSSISRYLRKELSSNDFYMFQKKYKENFDNFYLDDVDNFEEKALEETLISLDFIEKEIKKEAMVSRFRKVLPDVYRGSAPSIKEIPHLIKEYGIRKIISLDKETGEKISKVCRNFGIEHTIIPLVGKSRDLTKILSLDLKKTFIDNGPVFIHCRAGKDRTGFISALLKVKFDNMDPEEAIKEAKSLGFGLFLSDDWKKITKKYEKAIRAAGKDSNNADILSNTREYKSSPEDTYLDQAQTGSFAPYMTKTREYPFDMVYPNDSMDFDTRENRGIEIKPIKENNNKVPQVGTYNNSSGIRGAGPSENYGGFLHD